MRFLFENMNTLLPGDGALRCEKTNVGVADGVIQFVGAAPADFLPDRVFSGAGRLLSPGLVNAHTHAYMTVFRGAADDLPFHTWLFDRILPMEEKLTPDDCYWGALLGACEMIRSGVTCYSDMYILDRASAQAAADSGMRAVLSRGLAGDAKEPRAARLLAEAVAEAQAFSGQKKLTFRLAPHAPYTCTPDYIAEIAAMAKALGLGIHTHLAESRAEIAEIKEKYGVTPFEYAQNAGMFNAPTLAAHCVYMTAADIALAAAQGVSVATNPVSNLKLANGIAPIAKLLAAGVNVALGTDGAASNNTLNMVRELQFLCLLHKGKEEDSTALSAAKGLEIATQGGATALGLGTVTGSVAVGKQADLVIFNLERTHLTPQGDPRAALAYAAQGNEAETVMVGGDILFDQGTCTRLDEAQIRHTVSASAKKIVSSVHTAG